MADGDATNESDIEAEIASLQETLRASVQELEKQKALTRCMEDELRKAMIEQASLRQRVEDGERAHRDRIFVTEFIAVSLQLCDLDATSSLDNK
jgi:hypothetical protein